MSRLVSDDTWAVLTIWQEARGEPMEGKIAVGEVIRNRTARKYSSTGTVPSTVLWPFQFSGWDVHDPNRVASALVDDTDDIVKACQQAWQTAKDQSDIAKGALLYYAPQTVSQPPYWVMHATMVAEIGRHRFYLPV